MKPTSSWAAFETKPDLSRSASTPAIKRSTVHILVPSGGQAGLVRACLPQPRSNSDPARFRCGSRSPPCAPAPLLEALQTPDLPPLARQVVARKKSPGHRAPPSLPPGSAGSSDALPIGIATSSTTSHRPPPPPPPEGAAACRGISPQRSASTSPGKRTHDTSGLCASRTPPAPVRGAWGAASQSSAASAASEGVASSSAHAPRYVKRVVDASAPRVKRPPPPPPVQDGSSTTSRGAAGSRGAGSRGAGGSTSAGPPSPEQQQREAEARTREVLRSGKANARARARQAAEGGDAQAPASGGAGAADA